MAEICRDFCFCQVYLLKSDVEGIFDFFHTEKSVKPEKKFTIKHIDRFLIPSVEYRKKVGSVTGRLIVRIQFSPKQYLNRAKELLSKAKMTKVTKLYVEQKIEYSRKFVEEDAKYPPALFFALDVRDMLGFGFSTDVLPKILNAKAIKSNLDFLLKKTLRRSRYGRVCPDFQYDASKFKFVGGILPARLPVPKLISTKLGKPDLNSIKVEFEDSPIGLENLEMTKENGQLVLGLKIERKVNRFKDVYPKVLNEVSEIARLLLERVA